MLRSNEHCVKAAGSPWKVTSLLDTDTAFSPYIDFWLFAERKSLTSLLVMAGGMSITPTPTETVIDPYFRVSFTTSSLGASVFQLRGYFMVKTMPCAFRS